MANKDALAAAADMFSAGITERRKQAYQEQRDRQEMQMQVLKQALAEEFRRNPEAARSYLGSQGYGGLSSSATPDLEAILKEEQERADRYPSLTWERNAGPYQGIKPYRNSLSGVNTTGVGGLGIPEDDTPAPNRLPATVGGVGAGALGYGIASKLPIPGVAKLGVGALSALLGGMAGNKMAGGSAPQQAQADPIAQRVKQLQASGHSNERIAADLRAVGYDPHNYGL